MRLHGPTRSRRAAGEECRVYSFLTADEGGLLVSRNGGCDEVDFDGLLISCEAALKDGE